MDTTLLVTLAMCIGFLLGSHQEATHGRATKRLNSIKSLMREQDKTVNGPEQPTVSQYASMWVGIWLEVAPHEEA